MANKKITDLQLRDDFDETCNVPVDDTIQTFRVTGQQVLDFVQGQPVPFDYQVAAAVGSSALTISLKNRTGANPSSNAPASFKFKNVDGTFTRVNVTAATSVVVSSGSTLNHFDGREGAIYLYGLNNSGTLELAVSGSARNVQVLQSTTAEGGAGAADNISTLYSTTARTNKQIMLLAILRSTQTTAGTWAAVPSNIYLTNENPPCSEIKLYGWLSNGSSNTAISRFNSIAENFGDAITRATSSTAGDSFTINERGIYAVTHTNDGGGNVGISVNSNQLTTNINLITASHRMSSQLVSSADAFGTASWIGMLNVGDVVRGHTNASPGSPTFTDAANFTICQVARL